MNQMDVTRFALMKMMGGGRLPFPGAPPGVLDLGRESKDRREEEEEERENGKGEEEEEEERRLKEEGRRKLVQERTIDCKDFEGTTTGQNFSQIPKPLDVAGSSVKAVNNNENRMVVSLDLNNVTYQGVLFAQPINVSQSHNIQR